jgi:hypothetical protein
MWRWLARRRAAGEGESRVRIVALIFWTANVCVGWYLMPKWLSGGLRRQATKVTRFPLLLILSHPFCAAAGLGFWAAYVATGQVAFAWSAFGVLCGSSLLGFTMLTRWLPGRGGRHARGSEQHFPGQAVIFHGLVGVAILVLVLITATIVSKP